MKRRLRLHIRACGSRAYNDHFYYGTVADAATGTRLREWTSSSMEWLKHDLFERPSSQAFWAEKAPDGYVLEELIEEIVP